MPMVVAGLARVGKSHLMTRLIHDLQSEPPPGSTQPKIHVARRLQLHPGTPREILVDALHETLKLTEEALELHGSSRSAMAEIRDHIRQFSRLIDNPGSTISVTEQDLQQLRKKTSTDSRIDGTGTAGLHLTAKGGGGELAEIFGLPAGALGFQGTASLSGGAREGKEDETTTSSTKANTVHMPPIEERQLIALIQRIHRVARQAVPGWTTLLAFDDFDLLYRAENRSFDPKPLLRAMSDLARDDGLFVLATVRSDTLAENRRALCPLTELDPFPNSDILLQIYQRQVSVYWNRGVRPLKDSLVEDVAKRCDGRVGIFLDFLRDVLDTNPTYAAAEDYLQKKWSDLKRVAADRTNLIQLTIKNENYLIGGEDAARLRVGISHPWVYEDYTTSDQVTIHPVLASLLKEGKLT
jgi:hypothetical protein